MLLHLRPLLHPGSCHTEGVSNVTSRMPTASGCNCCEGLHAGQCAERDSACWVHVMRSRCQKFGGPPNGGCPVLFHTNLSKTPIWAIAGAVTARSCSRPSVPPCIWLKKSWSRLIGLAHGISRSWQGRLKICRMLRRIPAACVSLNYSEPLFLRLFKRNRLSIADSHPTIDQHLQVLKDGTRLTHSAK